MDKSVKITLLAGLILAIAFVIYKAFLSNSAPCETKSFHIDRTTILEGETIMVTDSSLAGSGIRWDFGDGEAPGLEKSMKHTYKKAGEYRLILTVNDKCSFDTLIKVLPAKQQVNKYEDAVIEGPEKAQVGSKLTFIVNKKGLTSYDWTFGENGSGNIDKTVTNDNEISYTYSTPGNYTIYLTLDKNHTLSKTIKIQPKPTGGGGIAPETVRSKLEAMFAAASDPYEVENQAKQLAAKLCNNKSVIIGFDPPLKTNSGKSISSRTLKELQNMVGMVSFYQAVKVTRISIPPGSGSCPERINAEIRQ